MISLEEEDAGGLFYEEQTVLQSDIDLRWCLVGRFLTESSIDFQAMQYKMASLWRPGIGMYVKEIEPNRYIFQFHHEVDINRVLEGSPWTFGRFHLFFDILGVGDNPRAVSLNKMLIWVQVHDMDSGFISQHVLKDIGDYIGEFKESDPNNFAGVWRDYLRVRVSISQEVPLKRRMKLRRSKSQWCWANFKYEGIFTFCFICGIIGHGKKFCEKIFNTPMESIPKPYGVWMRAEPRRRNYASGAKWLRQGSSFPVTETGTELTGGGDKSGSVIVDKESRDNS